MELVFENLVGRREQSGELEAVVVAEVTKGGFRVSPAVSAKLGLTDGSFVTLQKAGDKVYIGKGVDGVAKMDAEGNYEVDKRGHRIYEEGKTGFGAVAREITPGSGILRLSNAYAWSACGGNNDSKQVFELGEGVEASLPTGTGVHTTVLYPLEFVRSEDKMVRGATDSDEASAEGTQEAAQTESADEDFVEEEL